MSKGLGMLVKALQGVVLMAVAAVELRETVGGNKAVTKQPCKLPLVAEILIIPFSIQDTEMFQVS